MTFSASGLQYQDFVNLVTPYTKRFGSDPQFLQIVAAGALAESRWDVNAEQIGGKSAGGKGLFQFDFSGGMGSGLIRQGVISSYAQILGTQGARIQAQYIIPAYEQAYAEGLQKGLSGQNLATYTIGEAERPQGWTQGAVSWTSAVGSYENYVKAYNTITGASGTSDPFVPGTVGIGSTPGSAIVTTPGGVTDVPVPGQTTTPGQLQVPGLPQLTGIAGQIQTGLLGTFAGFAKGFGAGFFLLIGSVFAILIGSIIWNGDKVKKYAPDVAIATAA